MRKTSIASRIVAFFLSLALVFCNIPIVPVMADTVTDETGWRYKLLDNGTISIEGYVGADTQLVVPAQIAGHNVSVIGDYAFEGNSNITSVEIPTGIGTIGSHAFSGCKSLKTVTLGNVTSIYESSFGGCSSLTTINLDSVTNIASYAFSGCKSLSSITLGNAVSVGMEAFLNCTGLTSVTLGDLACIDIRTFQNCTMLTTINLENVKEIKNEAFSGCTVLKTINLNSVINIEQEAFINCTALQSIKLSETLIQIGESAFEGCRFLDNVSLPASVASIGVSAFEGCEGLTTITLPAELKTISVGLFSGCKGLTSIVLPDTVTTIGAGAFCDCSSLKTVTLPDSITSIEGEAFKNCISLTKVDLPASLTVISWEQFRNCTSLETVTIPEGLKTIQRDAFHGCLSLKEVVLPKSITEMESAVFYGCENLSNVTLLANINVINEDMFSECKSLKTIVIPETVTSIEDDAFQGCSSLNSIVLPEGLSAIGYHAISGCTSLTDLIIPATVKSIDSYGFNNDSLTYYCEENSVAHAFVIDKKYEYNFYYNIIPNETVELPVPVKPGYEFQGWYTQKTGGEQVTEPSAYTEKTMVYAQWKKLLSETDMSFNLSETEYTYNGMANIPEVTIKYGNITLAENTDYTVEYVNNTDAGIAMVTVTGIGAYAGTLSKTYTVNPQSISRAEVTFNPYEFTYDGTEKIPAVKVIVNSLTLEKDKDYTIEYSDYVNAGEPSIALVGIGNYTGNYNQNYQINKKSIEDATLTLSQKEYAYDGLEKEPEVTLQIGTVTLVKDKDYTVKYGYNVSPGTAYVTVTGIGNYTDYLQQEYEIIEYNLKNTEIIVQDAEYVYDGTEKLPEVKVGFKKAYLVKDTDYTVSITNNVNAGVATITITGIGKWTGSVERTFVINTADLSDATVTLSKTEYTYDGVEKHPSVTVLLGTTTLKEDVDYTVSYLDDTNVGSATVRIVGNGNYYGNIEKTYEIKPISLDGFVINMASVNYTYDGSAKTPSLTVATAVTDATAGELPETGKVTDETILVKDKDYTVTYENYVNIGTATVIVTGIGNYTGTLKKEFYIHPVNIESTEITILSSDLLYNGTAKTPDVVISYHNILLMKDVDYTVAYAENVNPGTATVTVTGIGNYTGSSVCEFIIQPISIEAATLVINPTEYVYDGTEKQPEVTVTLGETVLVKGTDYIVSYADTVNTGTATVTIEGIGKYAGTLSKTFAIHATSLETAVVTMETTSYIYDETAKTPEVAVVLGEKTLTKDVDFTVTYSNNKNAGTATATITGIGNYIGTLTKEFHIQPVNIESTEVTMPASEFVYDGTAKTPEVIAQYRGILLMKDVDYTVTYAENVNPGTATVTVTGMGNYIGSSVCEFIIQPISIEAATLVINPSEYVYDGTEKQPEVTVTLGETVLVKGTDYIISYADIVNTGIATVTVEGIGNYAGTLSKTFAIHAASLTTAKVTLKTTSYIYDGTAKTPEVTVVLGAKTLEEDVDFTVTYSNNKNAGTATVTITGIGNYADTKTQTFLINMPKVTNLKQKTQYATNKIMLTWDKITGANGYAVYSATSKNGTYKLVKTTSTNSFTHSGLKAGIKNYYKVRAYVTVNGKKVYGEYSDAKSMITKPGAPIGFTVSLKSKTAKITWSKATGVAGYEIYMANSRTGSYTKIKSASTSTTTYNKTGLVKGKKYYFKMRSYVTTGTGAKVYSGYSQIKAVTVK